MINKQFHHGVARGFAGQIESCYLDSSARPDGCSARLDLHDVTPLVTLPLWKSVDPYGDQRDFHLVSTSFFFFFSKLSLVLLMA